MIQQLQSLLERRVRQCVSDKELGCSKIERKKQLLEERKGEIVKAKATGKIIDQINYDDHHMDILYKVHFHYLIKQNELLFPEEEIETRRAKFYKQALMSDDEELIKDQTNLPEIILNTNDIDSSRQAYQYDRRKAIQYAERWWNDYNPAYHKFKDDCTNFISQCLHAGGAPMRGHPNRGNGWWMRGKNWSYSWSVANALRIYLQSSKSGLRAREVSHPSELLLGDVICYDFEGDGRFNHNTIVTAKDAYGMPLVNAHTTNSRFRYWAYEDSSAYTPNIKYKFYTIVDDV